MLKAVRFTGLALMAAQVGVSYSHALQAPTKRELPADVYLWVQKVLIRNYAAGVGVLETGAMLSTLAAAFLGRGHRDVTGNLAAFACSAAVIGVWAKFIEPINREVRDWTPETMPEDWEDKRERWHLLHFARLVISIIGFVALAVYALDEEN